MTCAYAGQRFFRFSEFSLHLLLEMQVNERIWIINHLLVILMGSTGISLYFNKHARLVKIHVNFDYDTNFTISAEIHDKQNR